MSLLSGITNMLHPGAAAPAGNAAVLGMQGAGPVGPAAAAGAAGAAGPFATGAAQAQVGGEGVQPPQTSKIVMGSVLKGAMNGVSMMFGLNFFGPKIPFVNKFMQGTIVPLLTKIPFLAKFAFPMSTLITIGAGALIGGALGLFMGMKKAKKAAAAYAEAQAAAAAAQPVGDPLVLGPDGQPLGMTPPETLPVIPNPKARKNKVMGKNYSGKANAAAGAHALSSRYHIVWGDTLWALARKNHTTVAAIVKANPGKITNPNKIYAGDTINLPKG